LIDLTALEGEGKDEKSGQAHASWRRERRKARDSRSSSIHFTTIDLNKLIRTPWFTLALMELMA